MHVEETELATASPRRLNAVQELSHLRHARRARRLQWLGAALVAYGLIGIVIFVVVATAINRPLEKARELSSAVEQQRAALVDSLVEAHTTIAGMGQGVGRMETSLTDARAATDRSATISVGIATSMYQLRDAMSISILGAQPLIGLAGGFDQAGSQLQLLSQDLQTISTALDNNRADVTTTAANLQDLATSVAALTESVRDGPGLEISEAALDSFRFSIFAVAGWLLVFAIGCVIAGGYLVWSGRRHTA